MRFLMLILLLAMAIIASMAESVYNEAQDFPAESMTTTTTTSLRGVSSFLAQSNRGVMKCNKFPRICRAKGSPKYKCCKKRCVNLAQHRLNCGKCGHKCKFSEICCKGKCVNPFSHRKHCGGCGNKCGGATKCAYGLCSYSN